MRSVSEYVKARRGVDCVRSPESYVESEETREADGNKRQQCRSMLHGMDNVTDGQRAARERRDYVQMTRGLSI